MQNALKHVGHLIHDEVGIKSVLFRFMKCVDDEDLFLSGWNDMLDEFDATENRWLKDLFELKRKWAKAYVKHHWCAGMRTTQLCESFNSHLKRFLRSDHSIPEFFKHFERLIFQLRHNEKHAEFDLCNKLPKLLINSPMIVQAGNIFTNPIFERFQKQFLRGVNSYVSDDIVDDGVHLIYTIIVVEGHRSERCVRRAKETNLLICNCGKFEMEGIPCCHMIKFLRDVLHATEISAKYIHKRWTRCARDETVHDIIGNVVEADPNLQEALRYKKLCHLATRLNVAAAVSEADYLMVIKNFENMFTAVDRRKTTSNASTSNDGNPFDEQYKSANGLKKKNAWRGQSKRREKAGYEAASRKKKKTYAKAGNMKSNGVECSNMQPDSPLPTSHASNTPISHAYFNLNPVGDLEKNDIPRPLARKILFPSILPNHPTCNLD